MVDRANEVVFYNLAHYFWIDKTTFIRIKERYSSKNKIDNRHTAYEEAE